MSAQGQFYAGRSRSSMNVHHRHMNGISASPIPSSPSSQSSQKWSCPVCTLENEIKRKKCEICLTPRPKSKSSYSHKSKSKSKSKAKSKPKSKSKSPRPQQIVTNPSSSSYSNNNHNNHNNHNDFNHVNDHKPKSIKFSTSLYETSPVSPISPTTPSNDKHFFRTGPGKMPKGPQLPEDVVFNPKKPISKQSIFERWMIAQIERASGIQPAICEANNVILTNLCRVRAPTTFHTIQQHIDENTDAKQHANNLAAGDFTDDEEDEVIYIYIYINIVHVIYIYIYIYKYILYAKTHYTLQIL